MTRYTTHLNIPYPDYKEKPYDTTISQGTFEGFDEAIHDINVQITDNIFDTIGTASAPGELRQNEGEEGSVATVKGFWDANDGGGGIFSWVVDATPPTDDGGTIIVPTGTPGGYWQRLFEGTIYNFKWFGGRSANPDNATYFNSMLASIGSNVATIYVPHDPGGTSTSYTVSTDVTIPINVNLWIEKGAYINNTVGTTFTVNSEIFASLSRIFDNAGTVNFGDKITYSFPEWFGAAGNGTTDDTNSLKEASAALIDDEQGTLVLTHSYKITGIVDIGGRSIIGQGKYAEIKNDDADSYVLMSGAGGSVDDTKFARFENILITLTSSATIGLNIRRRRVYGRNFRIVGVATNSHKALYFDLENEQQTFHDFDDFSIANCDYPYFLYTNRVSPATNLYFFNSNKIGSLSCYITNFVTGITLNYGLTGCSINTFGGYFEGGTNIVQFEGGYTNNDFRINNDSVTYLILTNATVGADTDGNRYHMYNPDTYTINTASTGTSYYDLIYTSQGLTLNRKQNYLMSAIGKAWFGLQAGRDTAADADVAIELNRIDSTAATQTWRKFGALGFKFYTDMIFYNTYNSTWRAKFKRTNAAIRRKLNERSDDYTITVEDDYYVTVSASGGNRTITLPPADDADGLSYKIKRVDATGNTVTISPDGSDTIEGLSSKSLASGEIIELVSDGGSPGNWVNFEQ
jgi:hypothetical protein